MTVNTTGRNAPLQISSTPSSLYSPSSSSAVSQPSSGYVIRNLDKYSTELPGAKQYNFDPYSTPAYPNYAGNTSAGGSVVSTPGTGSPGSVAPVSSQSVGVQQAQASEPQYTGGTKYRSDYGGQVTNPAYAPGAPGYTGAVGYVPPPASMSYFQTGAGVVGLVPGARFRRASTGEVFTGREGVVERRGFRDAVGGGYSNRLVSNAFTSSPWERALAAKGISPVFWADERYSPVKIDGKTYWTRKEYSPVDYMEGRALAERYSADVADYEIQAKAYEDLMKFETIGYKSSAGDVIAPGDINYGAMTPAQRKMFTPIVSEEAYAKLVPIQLNLDVWRTQKLLPTEQQLIQRNIFGSSLIIGKEFIPPVAATQRSREFYSSGQSVSVSPAKLAAVAAQNFEYNAFPLDEFGNAKNITPSSPKQAFGYSQAVVKGGYVPALWGAQRRYEYFQSPGYRQAQLESAAQELRGAPFEERMRVNFVSMITNPNPTGIFVDVFNIARGQKTKYSTLEISQAETLIRGRQAVASGNEIGFVVSPVLEFKSPLSIPFYYAGGALAGGAIGFVGVKAASLLPSVPLVSQGINWVLGNPKTVQTALAVGGGVLVTQQAIGYNNVLTEQGYSGSMRAAKISSSVLVSGASFYAGVKGFQSGFAPYAGKIFAPRVRVTEVTGLEVRTKTTVVGDEAFQVSRTTPITKSYVVKASDAPAQQLSGKGFYEYESTLNVKQLGGEARLTRTAFGESKGGFGDPGVVLSTRNVQQGAIFQGPAKQIAFQQLGGRLKLTEIDFEAGKMPIKGTIQTGGSENVVGTSVLKIGFDAPVIKYGPSVNAGAAKLFSLEFYGERPIQAIKMPGGTHLTGEILFPKLSPGRSVLTGNAVNVGGGLIQSMGVQAQTVSGGAVTAVSSVQRAGFSAPTMVMAFTPSKQVSRTQSVALQAPVSVQTQRQAVFTIQAVKPLQQSVYRTSLIELPQVKQREFSSSLVIPKSVSTQTEKTSLILLPKTTPQQKTSLLEITPSKTSTKTLTTLFGGGGFGFGGVGTPQPVVPPFGMLGSGFSGVGLTPRSRGTKRRLRYQPDITSILTGYTAKRAPKGKFKGLFSGIELRPVIR